MATASATIIKSQDFDSLPTGNESTSTGVPDGAVLINSGSKYSGGPGVGELGFESIWVDTRGESVGPVTASSDSSDLIGVTDSAPGGSNGFIMEDTDGRVELIFDSVDISGFSSVSVSVDYFIADTKYESDDSFEAFLSDDLGIIDSFSLSDSELEDASDLWQTLTFDNIETLISTGSSVVLTLAFDSNAGTEKIFFDNIAFSGTSLTTTNPVIPEPSTVGAAGLALLLTFFGFRRWKRKP